jgi:putative ABC transport system permease protein
MWKNYFKIAYRQILKHRMTSLVNFTGLTIGMVAAFFIFIWVNNEHSYDSYHLDASSIYRLTAHSDRYDTKSERTPYPLGEEIKAKIPDVIQLARMYPITYRIPTVKVGGMFYNEKAAVHVDEQWFSMFHYDFIQGDPRDFNRHPYSIILSASKAKTYFGHTMVVGETLQVDDQDYKIKGVVADYPSNSSFRYDFFMPVSARQSNAFYLKLDMEPIRNFYHTFVKLEASASPELTTAKIQSILHESFSLNYNISLFPFTGIHFEQDIGHSVIQRGDSKLTYMMTVLGVLLLGIACINYVNLTTARTSIRLREVGIRKIIGADRKQLFIQFVIESLIIGSAAFAASLLWVELMLPLLNRFADNYFSRPLSDPALWQLLGGIFLITLVLTSVYPALILSGLKPVVAVKGIGKGHIDALSLRKSLVVLQFVCSIILIVGTIVIYEQMQLIQLQNNHYDKTRVFSFQLPLESLNTDSEHNILETIQQDLQSQSSIEQVAIGPSLVKVENLWTGFDWEGHDPKVDYGITFLAAGTGYAELLKLQILEGRWFSAESAVDSKNFILNEAAVRELGIAHPAVGQRFIHDYDTGRVVGVVKDFHFASLREEIGPVVFSRNLQYANTILVKSEPGKQVASRIAAEKIFGEFVSDKPFDYQFVSEEFDHLYRGEKNVGTLVLIFSLLAVFVSCLGLYGLATFGAEQRLKEIGVRKVMGATVSGIVALLCRDFVKLVLIALIIASPLAWYAMNRWLADFAYRIDIEWWMFALAGLAAVVIALATVSFQAVRAAVANPVESLRSE